MENIDFVLWMVLYPISGAITSYLSVKSRHISGKDPYTDGILAAASWINIIIWVIFAIVLY